MNYVLTAVLILVVFYFAVGVYRLERDRALCRAYAEAPENLRLILKNMLVVVRAEGNWGRVERMRDELRLALRMINEIRHDRGNEALQASKRARARA